MQELLQPTTSNDTIREIIIFAIGLLLRYLEKKKLTKKRDNDGIS
jgi:hypothetical protein